MLNIYEDLDVYKAQTSTKYRGPEDRSAVSVGDMHLWGDNRGTTGSDNIFKLLT